MSFEPFLTTFDPFLRHFRPYRGLYSAICDPNRAKMGHFGWFWTIFGSIRVIFGSLRDHFGIVLGIILGSFRCRFDPILRPFCALFGLFFDHFWPFGRSLGLFLGQKPVIFGGFWGQKMDLNPKTLFWRGHLDLSIREGTRANGHE